MLSILFSETYYFIYRIWNLVDMVPVRGNPAPISTKSSRFDLAIVAIQLLGVINYKIWKYVENYQNQTFVSKELL
jgi:hypothetical protein